MGGADVLGGPPRARGDRQPNVGPGGRAGRAPTNVGASVGGTEGTPRAEGGAGTLRANPTDALLRFRPYRLPVSQ